MTYASNATQLVDATIGVAAHLEAELEEALAEHRLTRGSFLVLASLEQADAHTLNQREVVAKVRRTSGTMSVRLGRLERAGMISRERDPENGRSVTVTMSESRRVWASPSLRPSSPAGCAAPSALRTSRAF